MFDLNRLRLFRELARLQTMTAVAAKLNLTSSAVSQQLAILEEEAGALFLLSTRAVFDAPQLLPYRRQEG